MTQASAPMSPAIKFVTGLVLVMIVALFLAAGKVGGMLFAVQCSRLSPCSAIFMLPWPMSSRVISSRSGFAWARRSSRRVTGCETLTARPPRGVRLWGNGGLFAATGIFWNQAYGVFRAYLTSARYQDYVLVATRTQKILISPENPAEFVRTWAAPHPRLRPRTNRGGCRDVFRLARPDPGDGGKTGEGAFTWPRLS